MPRYRYSIGGVLVLALSTAACITQSRQVKSNALDFLYPKGAAAAAAGDVTLHVPVRVGVAFAPPGQGWNDSFTEAQKQTLLSRIAEAFKSAKGIDSVQVIPTSYLSPGGGFEALDRLKVAFGIDLIVLLSYDQFQFSESGRSSWAYWTIVGAYLVRGEKHETRTIVDAVVYDIPSRAMLFNAGGQSEVKGKATPVDVAKSLRTRSEEGFNQAVDDLIGHLGPALDAFVAQAASGTVRGAGTPAIALLDASGNPVHPGGGSGGGALGIVELLGAGLLVAAGLARRGSDPR